MLRALSIALAATVFSLSVNAQEKVDLNAVNRIMEEGFNRSQVMEHAGYLTDVIGPRLTGSPAMRQANDWSKEQFTKWGLTDAHLEGFEFGRGWTFSKSVVRMLEPRVAQLQALPFSWHPGTNGVIKGDAIHAVIASEDDFEKFKGKLAGKIVLLSDAGKPSQPSSAAFKRLEDKDLTEQHNYEIPNHADGAERFIKIFRFKPKLFAFLKEEGAIAAIERTWRDGGLLEASGYLHKVGQTPEIPALSMASEDYRRILRLLERDLPVTLELEVEAQFHDEDTQSYNTIAEIRGQGRNPEIVMAGAHLDSWFIGDGAVDNGAGSAVIMEAARILAAMNIKPKRTIRFALWGGEEQGLYGSQNYVERHFATRPAPSDEKSADLPAFFWYQKQWPVMPKAGYEKLSAYFNLDNGSGRIRGIYGEGNVATAAIFKQWLEPFHDLGAKDVVLNGTGGTDHLFFQWVGLPGFQFIQDPLDYGSRLHHTQVDTYDHIVADDMKQASVILASFLYHAAMREDHLPRRPIPQQPDIKEDAAAAAN